MSEVWAVLPIKDVRDAKQRLAGVLAREERAALFRSMLGDVLDAIAAARALDGLLVITRDPEAEALVAPYGAEILAEGENAGQTAAVTAGVEALAARGVGTIVTIPGDVPLATGAEIDAVLAAHGTAPAVTIAPAHDRLGSNAVVCSPPGALPLRFGDASFAPHVDRARALGIEPRIVERPGLGLDVDHPRDLSALLAVRGDTRTHRYLASTDVRYRLPAAL